MMPSNTTEETLLTPAKVAEILQISKAMVYTLLQQGKIPVIRINTLVRVRRADLERYIREQMELKAHPES
jgi:excisionase family DNA binding protein